MTSGKSKKNTDSRSRNVPINEENGQNPEDAPLERIIHPETGRHFELHISAAADPTHAQTAKAGGGQKKRSASGHRPSAKEPAPPAHTAPAARHTPVHHYSPASTRKKSRISRKIWNLLEWIAVSALIFTVLFFVINFSSYSMLLKNKLEKVTGTFRLDPYIEKMLNDGGTPAVQEPLPAITENAPFRSQIPPLKLEVAPPDDRVIIPRINQNVPIVPVSSENLIKRDWNALENDIQDALKDGVVHYPGTSQPGDRGNVVLTGHSSYFPWDPGRFKDVFALLHEIVVGDTVIVYHDQHKFTYEVYEKKVVNPDQVEVLTQEGDERLTLITCTPVGTNLRRLIVFARPV
jgi:LPXTG-site transpeptidase (sortase) family protein